MNDRYASPEADVLTTQAGEENYQYLGFWARVLASILDNIWISIVLVILLLALSQFGVIKFDMTSTSGIEYTLQTVIPLILIVTLWIKYASTPGKMAFGAKILDAKTFGEVPPPRLVLRYFAYFISLLPLGLGFLWVAFDSRKQGWHDKIAGTVVVKEIS
ncbi:MAG: RDD family protein [Ketobacteraceae bacterium]|nr:RDD family protein [Ketobacteraceae bacterium]